MLNRNNTIIDTMLCRNTYIVITLIVILNIIVFPGLSLFPFQWAILLGALLANIFIKKAILKCITVIIILLLSGAVLFMDIIGCLFLPQHVFYCALISVLALFSILNVVLSVKLLIDDFASFWLK